MTLSFIFVLGIPAAIHSAQGNFIGDLIGHAASEHCSNGKDVSADLQTCNSAITDVTADLKLLQTTGNVEEQPGISNENFATVTDKICSAVSSALICFGHVAGSCETGLQTSVSSAKRFIQAFCNDPQKGTHMKNVILCLQKLQHMFIGLESHFPVAIPTAFTKILVFSGISKLKCQLTTELLEKVIENGVITEQCGEEAAVTLNYMLDRANEEFCHRSVLEGRAKPPKPGKKPKPTKRPTPRPEQPYREPYLRTTFNASEPTTTRSPNNRNYSATITAQFWILPIALICLALWW